MEMEETLELKFWKFIVKEIPKCTENAHLITQLKNMLHNYYIK